jgi:hypothetical protein
MTKSTIIAIVLGVIVIGAIIFSTRKNDEIVAPNINDQGQISDINNNINNNSNGGNNVVFSETETAIRMKVVEFGQKLKNVNTLAADYKNQVQSQYGTYVTPDLLAKWKATPSLALARTASSPWPDRIEIVKVTKTNDTTYKIEGNVIEVSVDQPVLPVVMYPVTITVQQDRGVWLITAVTKGTVVKMPVQISVNGVWECLPHKVTSGPQTLECAFGVKADNGKHYAVNLEAVPGDVSNTPINSRVRVEGALAPMSSANSNMWQIYPIEGIINAVKITQL